MEIQPSYYAVIPSDVRYDKRLKSSAKLLYAEITSLCNKTGVCWADNNYFAELYEVNHKTISRLISQLESCGYLSVKVDKLNGNSREIAIDKKVTSSCQKSHYLVTKKSLPSDEIVTSYKDNNKYNNKNNNTREFFSISYFKNNYPSQYEKFLMEFKKQIDDFELFTRLFDLKMEQEMFDVEKKQPAQRLTSFALQYVSNRKNKSTQAVAASPDPYKHLKAK
jgi:hypothetical protein